MPGDGCGRPFQGIGFDDAGMGEFELGRGFLYVIAECAAIEFIEPEGAWQGIGNDVGGADRVFEANDVVRRGDAFAVVFARRVADAVVIVLVVAAQGVAEIVGERVAEQFVRGAQAVVAQGDLQLPAVREDFGFAVEIEVDRNQWRARLQGVASSPGYAAARRDVAGAAFSKRDRRA